MYKWAPDKVTKQFIKKVAYRRDMESLETKVKSGKLSDKDMWLSKKQKSKLGLSANCSSEPIVDNTEPPEPPASPGKDDIDGNEVTSDEPMSRLMDLPNSRNSIVLGGDDSDLLEQLKKWIPTRESLTNGVVLEVANKKNSDCTSELIRKIFQFVGVHPTQQCSKLVKRQFTHYVTRTAKTCFKNSEIEDPWLFLDSLCEGGKLFKPELLRPVSKFDETMHILTEAHAKRDTAAAQVCMTCSSVGDLFCCQGCFAVFYCSETCQREAWLTEHSLECSSFAKTNLGYGAKLPPQDLLQLELERKYRNTLKLIGQLEKKNLQLEQNIQSVQEDNDQLLHEQMSLTRVVKDMKAENLDLREALIKVKREKAGKSSAFAKLKRKFDEIDEEEHEDNDDSNGILMKTSKSQTIVSVDQDTNLVEIQKDVSSSLRKLEIYTGKELKFVEKRNYGESTFVRIPSSRNTTWPNDLVSTRTVQSRALATKDFVKLISGACNLPLDRAAKVEKLLFIELVKQNKEIFTDLLRSNKDVLCSVMKLTPDETSKLMHLSNTSYSGKRKIATMLGKVFNFNPFASEKKQREAEKMRKALVERSKLEHGALLLHKTALSEYATLCAFVRVSNLSSFVADLVILALSEDTPDLSSMKNLDHPLYYNKLWVVIGGDKGGTTMKFVTGVGGNDPHMFGMFQAADTPDNLLAFQADYYDQVKRMIAFGLKVSFEDGNTRLFEVEVMNSGDKAYLSDQNGHAGGASSYPSIYRLVTSAHLRKKHLDGSSHTPENSECVFEDRTPESIDKNYHENVVDTRAGSTRRRGKHHNSIVGPRLLPLVSQLHNSVSSLHIGLAVVLRMIDYIEIECEILDGNKTEDDKQVAEKRFDRLEEGVDNGTEEECVDEESVEGVCDNENEEGYIEENRDCGREGLIPSNVPNEDDEVMTDVIRQNRVRREVLETEWQAKSLEVLEAVSLHKDVSEQVQENMLKLKRIEHIEAGDKECLEKMAKKASKARHSLKSFKNWKPLESWRCDDCLLTGFDRNILWRVCRSCHKNTHLYCQAFSEEEEELLTDETFQCRPCSGVVSLPQIKQHVCDQIESLKARSFSVSKKLSTLQQEESALKKECTMFMGATRLQLQDILENKLGVNRADYHSNCFVGNHCDVIVERYTEITEVLSSKPEIKRKYDDFFKYYKPVHFLMKASRFLTNEELDRIDACCMKIGEVYPKHFKASITPKLDDLIFVVPKFARRWTTVGGLREEKIEGFHNTSKYYPSFSFKLDLFSFYLANRILGVLFSVRKADLKLVLAVERSELKQSFGASFVKPVERIFFCPDCRKKLGKKTGLIDRVCPDCGFKKV